VFGTGNAGSSFGQSKSSGVVQTSGATGFGQSTQSQTSASQSTEETKQSEVEIRSKAVKDQGMLTAAESEFKDS